MGDQTLKSINKAKIKIMTSKGTAFYSSLLARLQIELTDKVPTAGVNSKKMVLNPKFVDSLTQDQLVFLLLHEVMHLVYMHHVRFLELTKGHHNTNHHIEPKHHRLYNAAGDYLINLQLVELGFKMPNVGLLDPQYKDMGTSEIFFKLLDEGSDEQPDHDDLMEEAGEGGELSEDQLKKMKAEVENLVLETAQMTELSRGAGHIPGHIKEMLAELLNPKQPWEQILMDRMTQRGRDDYSRRRPSKRYRAHGLYMPTLDSERFGDIVAAFDVSGSVSKQTLENFMGELKGIFDELNPTGMKILSFDTRIQQINEYEEYDEFEALEITGRGGTEPECVFTYLEEDPPEFLLVFTDGEFEVPPEPPIDIYWVIYDNPKFQADYGEIIYVETS